MVHIIGANGYIGHLLCNYLVNKHVPFDCYSDIEDERCQKFDLTDFNEEHLNFNADDIVVLLAAISSPDVCQNNYNFAYSINVKGTSNFIDYCIKQKCRVIFFSSDTVNGSTGNEVFDEFSHVNPFGNYAKMKYEIEHRYKDCPLFKTLRLSYVLSPEDKFCKYLTKCVNSGIKAEVFEGLFRNVITIETVLEATYCLIQNFEFNDYYLVNVSGNQSLSRRDLAEWYKVNINKNLCYNIIPVPEDILKGRPNIIRTKSLFLNKLLGRKLENLI